MNIAHLGYFESTENVNFLFQYIDDTNAYASPVSPPVFRIYQSNGTQVTGAALTMTAQAFTGQYRGSVNIDDWDSLGSVLTPGKYLIFVYTTDTGSANSAYYYFDVVATNTNIASQGGILVDLDALFAPAISAASLGAYIEDSVWDADPADHVAADTFAEVQLSADNKADLLSALGITAGFTAGNDLASIASSTVKCEAVAVGRWKVDGVSKSLTLYELDDTTPLVVFDLKDSEGDLTTVDIFERTPQ